ncbi:copper homeostasis protein CutC [Peribacillus muralis]|uniref:copper homeostasis protein CutC n=1 Tax=Peribacillus muralis TaxID=264697 RepID=UPI001F4D85E4|nr:copper homeostasis protein CutC [Peribacillus muralis]MCK1992042.1 copper homeostasis protein CutC [Peribacillus muralis]MCK2012598.1 copper homeostasis protein CutC [Peribacillus muralis]
MYIEFIATTIEDAIVIEQSGADRIELVSSLAEGGLTPSHALIEAVVHSVKIPVNVMVRPHSQSFCYSERDLDIMKNDIRIIRTLGANGVVLGALNDKNEINRSYLKELLAECAGLEVTFHRAIDDTADPIQSAEMLSHYPEITTILTSGGHGDLPSRMKTIQQMKATCGHIAILVGSGLNKDNILSIDSELNTGHYHFGTAVRKNNSLIEGVQVEKAKEIVNLLKNG